MSNGANSNHNTNNICIETQSRVQVKLHNNDSTEPTHLNKLNVNIPNRGKTTAARKRWSILAHAICKENLLSANDVSVRRFTSFELFAPQVIKNNWYKFATKDSKYSVEIQYLQGSITAIDLIGFNNTGNICIWPSEETLACYVLANLSCFYSKKVLELGGGMSCLAGLMVAKYGKPCHVELTDGNFRSIQNIEYIITRNELSKVTNCSELKWESTKYNMEKTAFVKTYDIILVADCVFFDESRQDLIDTIWYYLAKRGTAFVMAPRRGQTLDHFISKSKLVGFSCSVLENYEATVWHRHLQLLKSNSDYDANLHYPILIILEKNISQ